MYRRTYNRSRSKMGLAKNAQTAIILFLIIVAAPTGWLLGTRVTELFQQGTKLAGIDIGPSPTSGVPGVTGPAPVTGVVAAVKKTALLQFSITDKVAAGTSLTATNTILNIVKDGKYEAAFDSITVDAAPETSIQSYTTGDKIELWAASDIDGTGGTDYYNAAYVINSLEVGASVIDKRTGEVIGTVSWYEGGDASRWVIGKLPVTRRTTAANLDVTISYSGTTLASVTDGSTWVTTANQATGASLASNSEDLFININLGTTVISYGTPFYTLTSDSPPKLQTHVAVAWVTFSATGVTIDGEGWTKLTTQPTGYIAYGVQLPEVKGTNTQKGSYAQRIPIRTEGVAASTHFTMQMWLADGQVWAQAVSGTGKSTSPSAYGALSASNSIGIDAIVFARPYSLTSGDVPQSEVLEIAITSPA